MPAYYNDSDPHCVAMLRDLIAQGVIAPGDVDSRSIREVRSDDLAGYEQVHLFAGGGAWSIALRLAGVPDNERVWTGSCPCQPFSNAGKDRKRENDSRHLWPHFNRLIATCKPHVVFGEQVSSKAGYVWFDGVATDLESQSYACEAFNLPACAIGAPHIRSRLYWLAIRLLEDSESIGRRDSPGRDFESWNAPRGRLESKPGSGFFTVPSDDTMLESKVAFCDDRIARRRKFGVPVLDDDAPRRMVEESLIGNAIVPALAAEFIRAYYETA